ncbi:uncharacterized protein LOC116286615 [Actinia tenebrosa]|uniref:Uncharacterized protein LOC116286615 n=1 Tax=Actinia tenebrosa TaxID=6105 RepID=A0A6P8H8F2_ACTTE|nr:uncharacterized protein LOC116286615 [Actinia tenebrosa]
MNKKEIVLLLTKEKNNVARQVGRFCVSYLRSPLSTYFSAFNTLFISFHSNCIAATQSRPNSAAVSLLTRYNKKLKSLQFSQNDIDEVKSKVRKLEEDLLEAEDKIDYLENQSRRNNVRISGIKEDNNESWSTTEDKVKTILKEKMGMFPENVEIERAHRTGKPRIDKPRQIVVKFLRYKDRESVLDKRKSLKGTGIFVNEDLSSRVLKRRQEQQGRLEEARKEGKIAYFRMDHLVIKNRAFQTPSRLHPFRTLGASAGIRSDGLVNASLGCTQVTRETDQ